MIVYFKQLVFIISAFISTLVLGQSPGEFGKVTISELESRQCDFDTAATAAILFDVVKTDNLTSYKSERHQRIKFYKNAGIDKWANLNLFYNKSSTRISDFKAVTYNLVDGKVVTTNVESKNIFETKFNKQITKLSIALPKVVPGSVIEYSYTLRSLHTYSSDMAIINSLSAVLDVDFFDVNWEYQHEIPAYWCDYTYRGNYHAYYIQSRIPVIEDHSDKVSHWIAKNVPAFRQEPYSLPKSDLIGKVYIDKSSRTWEGVAKSYGSLANFGKGQSDSSLVRQIASKFVKIPNDVAKRDSIMRYVKKQIKWNETIDQYPDRDRNFVAVVSSGIGSSCEINLTLMALLTKAGLKSYPVLISTRNHGTIAVDRPRTFQFNDLITCVAVTKADGKKEIVLLDATDRNLSNEYIPLRCLNSYGLVIAGEESELVPIVSSKKSKIDVTTNLKFDTVNKEVEGDAEIAFYGLFAQNERVEYNSKGSEQYENRVSREYPSKEDKVTVLNVKDGNQPLKNFFKLRDGALARFSADHIYMSPFVIIPPEVNKLSAETRNSAIDLTPIFQRLYLTKIEIPTGFSVEETPKPSLISLPNNAAKFTYSISQHGNSLTIMSQLVFNNPIFLPEEYASVREFMSQVLSKQSEVIVLRKN